MSFIEYFYSVDFVLTPINPIIPEIIHNTIQTATNVPPNIAPTTDDAINNNGIIEFFAPNIIAENIIVKNDAKIPNHPNCTIVLPAEPVSPVADSNAPTNPPAIKVKIAAKKPNIPPINPIMPDAFFI